MAVKSSYMAKKKDIMRFLAGLGQRTLERFSPALASSFALAISPLDLTAAGGSPRRCNLQLSVPPRQRVQRRSGGQIEIIRAASLSKLPNLVHGFSTRVGGFSQAYG